MCELWNAPCVFSLKKIQCVSTSCYCLCCFFFLFWLVIFICVMSFPLPYFLLCVFKIESSHFASLHCLAVLYGEGKHSRFFCMRSISLCFFSFLCIIFSSIFHSYVLFFFCEEIFLSSKTAFCAFFFCCGSKNKRNDFESRNGKKGTWRWEKEKK